MQCPSLSRDHPCPAQAASTCRRGVTVGQRAGATAGLAGGVFVGGSGVQSSRVPGTLASQGLVCAEKRSTPAHTHMLAHARDQRQGVRALRAIASKLGGTKGRTRKRFLLWPLLPIRTHFSNSAFADSTFNLASANPTTRTQDAGLQEPRFGAEVSFCPCSHLQHVQRSTPSHFH